MLRAWEGANAVVSMVPPDDSIEAGQGTQAISWAKALPEFIGSPPLHHHQGYLANAVSNRHQGFWPEVLLKSKGIFKVARYGTGRQ